MATKLVSKTVSKPKINAGHKQAARHQSLVLSVIIGGILLIAGLGSVIFLASKNQDLRQQAAGTRQSYWPECQTSANCKSGLICEGGWCVRPPEPTPLGCISDRYTKGCPTGYSCTLHGNSIPVCEKINTRCNVGDKRCSQDHKSIETCGIIGGKPTWKIESCGGISSCTLLGKDIFCGKG